MPCPTNPLGHRVGELGGIRLINTPQGAICKAVVFIHIPPFLLRGGWGNVGTGVSAWEIVKCPYSYAQALILV